MPSVEIDLLPSCAEPSPEARSAILQLQGRARPGSLKSPLSSPTGFTVPAPKRFQKRGLFMAVVMLVATLVAYNTVYTSKQCGDLPLCLAS